VTQLFPPPFGCARGRPGPLPRGRGSRAGRHGIHSET
jgi:hypothetical protein